MIRTFSQQQYKVLRCFSKKKKKKISAVSVSQHFGSKASKAITILKDSFDVLLTQKQIQQGTRVIDFVFLF
jgi:hypothetical protein